MSETRRGKKRKRKDKSDPSGRGGKRQKTRIIVPKPSVININKLRTNLLSKEDVIPYRNPDGKNVSKKEWMEYIRIGDRIRMFINGIMDLDNDFIKVKTSTGNQARPEQKYGLIAKYFREEIILNIPSVIMGVYSPGAKILFKTTGSGERKNIKEIGRERVLWESYNKALVHVSKGVIPETINNHQEIVMGFFSYIFTRLRVSDEAVAKNPSRGQVKVLKLIKLYLETFPEINDTLQVKYSVIYDAFFGVIGGPGGKIIETPKPISRDLILPNNGPEKKISIENIKESTTILKPTEVYKKDSIEIEVKKPKNKPVMENEYLLDPGLETMESIMSQQTETSSQNPLVQGKLAEQMMQYYPTPMSLSQFATSITKGKRYTNIKDFERYEERYIKELFRGREHLDMVNNLTRILIEITDKSNGFLDKHISRKTLTQAIRKHIVPFVPEIIMFGAGNSKFMKIITGRTESKATKKYRIMVNDIVLRSVQLRPLLTSSVPVFLFLFLLDLQMNLTVFQHYENNPEDNILEFYNPKPRRVMRGILEFFDRYSYRNNDIMGKLPSKPYEILMSSRTLYLDEGEETIKLQNTYNSKTLIQVIKESAIDTTDVNILNILSGFTNIACDINKKMISSFVNGEDRGNEGRLENQKTFSTLFFLLPHESLSSVLLSTWDTSKYSIGNYMYFLPEVAKAYNSFVYSGSKPSFPRIDAGHYYFIPWFMVVFYRYSVLYDLSMERYSVETIRLDPEIMDMMKAFCLFIGQMGNAINTLFTSFTDNISKGTGNMKKTGELRMVVEKIYNEMPDFSKMYEMYFTGMKDIVEGIPETQTMSVVEPSEISIEETKTIENSKASTDLEQPATISPKMDIIQTITKEEEEQELKLPQFDETVTETWEEEQYREKIETDLYYQFYMEELPDNIGVCITSIQFILSLLAGDTKSTFYNWKSKEARQDFGTELVKFVNEQPHVILDELNEMVFRVYKAFGGDYKDLIDSLLGIKPDRINYGELSELYSGDRGEQKYQAKKDIDENQGYSDVEDMMDRFQIFLVKIFKHTGYYRYYQNNKQFIPKSDPINNIHVPNNIIENFDSIENNRGGNKGRYTNGDIMKYYMGKMFEKTPLEKYDEVEVEKVEEKEKKKKKKKRKRKKRKKKKKKKKKKKHNTSIGFNVSSITGIGRVSTKPLEYIIDKVVELFDKVIYRREPQFYQWNNAKDTFGREFAFLLKHNPLLIVSSKWSLQLDSMLSEYNNEYNGDKHSFVSNNFKKKRIKKMGQERLDELGYEIAIYERQHSVLEPGEKWMEKVGPEEIKDAINKHGGDKVLSEFMLEIDYAEDIMISVISFFKDIFKYTGYYKYFKENKMIAYNDPILKTKSSLAIIQYFKNDIEKNNIKKQFSDSLPLLKIFLIFVPGEIDAYPYYTHKYVEENKEKPKEEKEKPKVPSSVKGPLTARSYNLIESFYKSGAITENPATGYGTTTFTDYVASTIDIIGKIYADKEKKEFYNWDHSNASTLFGVALKELLETFPELALTVWRGSFMDAVKEYFGNPDNIIVILHSKYPNYESIKTVNPENHRWLRAQKMIIGTFKFFFDIFSLTPYQKYYANNFDPIFSGDSVTMMELPKSVARYISNTTYLDGLSTRTRTNIFKEIIGKIVSGTINFGINGQNHIIKYLTQNPISESMIWNEEEFARYPKYFIDASVFEFNRGSGIVDIPRQPSKIRYYGYEPGTKKLVNVINKHQKAYAIVKAESVKRHIFSQLLELFEERDNINIFSLKSPIYIRGGEIHNQKGHRAVTGIMKQLPMFTWVDLSHISKQLSFHEPNIYKWYIGMFADIMNAISDSKDPQSVYKWSTTDMSYDTMLNAFGELIEEFPEVLLAKYSTDFVKALSTALFTIDSVHLGLEFMKKYVGAVNTLNKTYGGKYNINTPEFHSYINDKMKFMARFFIAIFRYTRYHDYYMTGRRIEHGSFSDQRSAKLIANYFDNHLRVFAGVFGVERRVKRVREYYMRHESLYTDRGIVHTDPMLSDMFHRIRQDISLRVSLMDVAHKHTGFSVGLVVGELTELLNTLVEYKSKIILRRGGKLHKYMIQLIRAFPEIIMGQWSSQLKFYFKFMFSGNTRKLFDEATMIKERLKLIYFNPDGMERLNFLSIINGYTTRLQAVVTFIQKIIKISVYNEHYKMKYLIPNYMINDLVLDNIQSTINQIDILTRMSLTIIAKKRGTVAMRALLILYQDNTVLKNKHGFIWKSQQRKKN